MSVNIILKDVEVDAGKVLSFLTRASKATPAAAAALGVILGAVSKVVGDAAAVAGAPATALSVTFDQATIADLKAVWPDVKELATTLGIKL
jgi:hypothetical protein